MKRTIHLFSTVFIAATALSTMAAADLAPLRVLIGNTAQSPYAETASADTLAAINAAVLGQLLKCDDSFNLRPGLVESWGWEPEKSAYVLKLKPNIVFHNGRKATSADLEFSLLRGFFSQHRSFYNIYLGNIDGIAELSPGVPFKSGAVRGVKITGPLSVAVRLSNPNPSFLFSLVNAYFSLVPIEELNPDYITWKRFPVGAGPYRVVKAYDDGAVRLKRSDTALPTAPELIDAYTDSNKGPFDVSVYSPAQSSVPNAQSARTRLPTYVQTLYFSNIHPLSKIPEFRKAVALAINRTKLLEKAPEFGDAVFEMLPRHFWGRNNIPDPLNAEKAKAIVSTLPTSLTSKTWRVPVFSGKELSPVAKAFYSELKSQLERIGISFEFYPSQDKFIHENIAKESPMWTFGLVADYLDPLIMFSSFRKNSPYRFNYTDDKIEALYLEAAKHQQQDERVRTIQALSRLIDDKILAVPLTERYIYRSFNSAVVDSLGDQFQPLTFQLEQIRLKASRSQH